ncbi:DUF6394 family protein [Caldimonas tepidiphila]|uniref:DUF6394 family protein n=1 Tax=Caldimonas tepidiphila TaxID=2315841 RepID=UPI000E5BD8C1|nr:DUF6394 family protein [Caldimonas tepidiphila]
MSLEKTVFAFFIVLALTLNFGFFYGASDDLSHHSPYTLFAALVANLVAMVLKFGDRTHVGATMLATSVAANLHLIAASVLWAVASQVYAAGNEQNVIAAVVSLAGGALIANIVSVVLLVAEALSVRR